VEKDDKQQFDFIVIGSGIGGVSAATYLVKAGYSVLVLERHYRPGGYTHSFSRKEYTFDSAVRIVAGAQKNGLMNKLLQKMNINDLESIELKEVYTAVYPEHIVNVKAGIEGIINSYSAVFPNDRSSIIKLISEMQEIYDCTIELLENENPIDIFADTLYNKYIKVTFQEFLEKFIDNPKLLYSLQAMCGYFGASPENGSAAYFSYAIMSFFVEGAYYIKGSFQKLSLRIIKEFEKSGGHIKLNAEVEKIICDNNQVEGVKLKNGLQYKCNQIIYNGDFTNLVNHLVGRDKFPERYIKRSSKIDIAMSAYEVFIVTDLNMKDFSISHETFIYDSYKYGEIYEQHKGKAEGMNIHGVAISCPTLVDNSLCPEGHHLLVISTMVASEKERNWSSVKQLYTVELIKIVEKVIPELSKHIIYLEAATPNTMHRYTLNTNGSCYGWEQNYLQTQYRPKQKTPIKGLYLSGHWTEPGGGIVAAMLSGYKISNKLIRDSENVNVKRELEIL